MSRPNPKLNHGDRAVLSGVEHAHEVLRILDCIPRDLTAGGNGRARTSGFTIRRSGGSFNTVSSGCLIGKRPYQNQCACKSQQAGIARDPYT